MNKSYKFFLGCIMPLRYPGVEAATREVCKILDIDLLDFDGASCCPAPGVIRSFDKITWLTLAARNLALAQGNQVATVCNGCYGSLFEAAHLLKDENTCADVNKRLKETGVPEITEDVKVRHLAEVFYRDIGLQKIEDKITTKLDGLNVAVHYGCHFLKPSKIKQIENPERPKIVDELVEITGATSVDYPDKQMCCGAGGGVRSGILDASLKMTEHKLDILTEKGVDCLVDICPFCHLQFDRGQKEINKGHNIPVLHLSQLYAIAMGVDEKKIGLDKQAIPIKLESLLKGKQHSQEGKE